METFYRTAAVYLFLLVLFRLLGKRTISELTTFDFILLLIISEATQNALIGDDNSLVTGMAVILILVLLDLALSILKSRSRLVDRIVEGVPVVLVDRGKVLPDCLRRTHVTEDDILQAGRELHGLGRLEQIRYAVLESNGGISIIPMEAERDDEEFERRIERAMARVLERRGGRS